MTDTTDPTTGFITHSGGDAWGQTEAPQAEPAAAPVDPGWGSVGQGAGLQQDTTGPFDPAKLGDFSYYQAHKTEILAAYAAGELTNP